MAVYNTIKRNAAKHLEPDEQTLSSLVGSTLSFGLSFAPLWASVFLTATLDLPDAVAVPLAVIGIVSAAYFFWRNENFAIIITNQRTLLASSGRSSADRVDEIVCELPVGTKIEQQSWFHSTLAHKGKTIRFGRKQRDLIEVVNERLDPTT